MYSSLLRLSGASLVGIPPYMPPCVYPVDTSLYASLCTPVGDTSLYTSLCTLVYTLVYMPPYCVCNGM